MLNLENFHFIIYLLWNHFGRSNIRVMFLRFMVKRVDYMMQTASFSVQCFLMTLFCSIIFTVYAVFVVLYVPEPFIIWNRSWDGHLGITERMRIF